MIFSTKVMHYFKGHLGALAVFFALAFYQSFYAFSYFPITEGWFSEYAVLMRAGNIPYRDFSLLMPPLYPLLLVFIQNLFGESLIVLRIIGIGITSLIGVVLWSILRKYFSIWISAFAAVIATIFYQQGNAYIGYDFTQILSLYLLCGAYFIFDDVYKIASKKEDEQQLAPIFFAGIFLSLAAFVKQSNGGVGALILFVGYLFCIFKILPFRDCIHKIIDFLAGCFVVAFPILVWLMANDALILFFEQTVVDALRAKGGHQKLMGWISGFFMAPSYFDWIKISLLLLLEMLIFSLAPSYVAASSFDFKSLHRIFFWKEILFPAWLVKITPKKWNILVAVAAFIFLYWLVEAIPLGHFNSWLAQSLPDLFFKITLLIIYSFSLVFIIFLLKKYQHVNEFIKNINHGYWQLISENIIGIAGIFLLFLLASLIRWELLLPSKEYLQKGGLINFFLLFFIPSISLFALPIFAIYLSISRSKEYITVFLLFIFQVALLAGNGTSAGLSEISIYFGVAVMIASILQLTSINLLSALIPFSACILLSCYLIDIKFQSPYAWWSITSKDVRRQVCAPTTGKLYGLCIEPKTYDAITRLVNTIKLESSPNDRLYVFPHLPIFNLLSQRLPYQNAVVSWFDFSSQSQILGISTGILREPPPLLLIARLPKEVFESHEMLFNDSKILPQRYILEAVDEQVKRGRLSLVETETVDGLKLELYKRN
jgi:hypothetical protein